MGLRHCSAEGPIKRAVMVWPMLVKMGLGLINDYSMARALLKACGLDLIVHIGHNNQMGGTNKCINIWLIYYLKD